MFYLPLLLRLVFAGPAVPQGAPAPPVVVERLGSGREQRLQLQGHPHLIVFFSTWCTRCPQYLRLLMRAPELRRGGVELVPVDLLPSELPGDVQVFWRRLGRSAPLYLDRYGQVTDAYQVANLPTAVLINKKGRIVGTLEGAKKRAELRRLLERLKETARARTPRDRV